MTIIRAPRGERYTVLQRVVINDERLSFRALGLLAYILDKPDDWRIEAQELSASHREGRDAVRTALTELEDCGYLTRRKYKNPRGQFATDSIVSEVAGQPPGLGNRSGKPALADHGGNPGSITNTEIEDCTNTDNPPTPQGGNADGFSAWWLRYPRKIDRGKCERRWRRMSDTERSAAYAGLDKWIAYWAGVEADKVPHPTTWLNNERWLADPPKSGPALKPGSGLAALQRQRESLQEGKQ